MAYKKNAEMRQASLRRITPRRLGDFATEPSSEEYIENLKAIKRSVDEELCAQRLRGLNKLNPRRMELVAKAQEIQAELTKLNSREKFSRDFSHYICRAVKESVTKPQWDIWVERAKVLQQEDIK